MSHSEGVYVQGAFSEPMSAQHDFADRFDLENPAQAMSSYNKIMHEHTKRQLSMATSSARRRSSRTTSPVGIRTESSHSSVSSVSSTGS